MNRAGGTVPVQSMKACVVYDQTSGRIHHHHSVVTFVGGREPSVDEIAANALRAVHNRPNPPSGGLHILHIDHDAMEPGKRYRVDHHKKALVIED